MVEHIIQLIQEAQASWTGADWPHEAMAPCPSPQHGRFSTCIDCRPMVDAGGVAIICDGHIDGCQLCADAASDAASAAAFGDEAVALLRAGRLREAEPLLRRAASIEATYGDAAAWRRPLLAIEDALDLEGDSDEE